MTPPRKPLLYRTRRRHHWEVANTRDGNTYIRCAKRLKERWSGLDNGRSSAAAVITQLR